MGFLTSMDISASALTAQNLRMNIIAENVANANTTRTANGQPYRRKVVVFQQQTRPVFEQFLKESENKILGAGVKVSSVVTDDSPFKLVYDPTHPDADMEGYVRMPNVDISKEMVDMISATRSYEANVTAMNAFKAMALKALEIGR